MNPLTQNPNAVVLLNPEGKIEAIASNIAADFAVTITSDPAVYRDLALNKPFDVTLPVQVPQVLAMRKS